MSEWRPIQGYEGLYEINECAQVRRNAGSGTDGRKVNEHMLCPSKAQHGMCYVSLWKNGKRKSHMQHKLYAAAFHITENEAVRRLYYGFHGNQKAVERICILLENMQKSLEQEAQKGHDRHDEILYVKAFLSEIKNDNVHGIS